MTKGNIYIAGPINGVKNYAENFNRAAASLRQEGWQLVVSPAEVTGDSLREILYYEFHFLILCADAIYMLKDWEKSLGAQAEWALARALSLKIYYQE